MNRFEQGFPGGEDGELEPVSPDVVGESDQLELITPDILREVRKNFAPGVERSGLFEDLSDLQDRLRSRVQLGQIADIARDLRDLLERYDQENED